MKTYKMSNGNNYSDQKEGQIQFCTQMYPHANPTDNDMKFKLQPKIRPKVIKIETSY